MKLDFVHMAMLRDAKKFKHEGKITTNSTSDEKKGFYMEGNKYDAIAYDNFTTLKRYGKLIERLDKNKDVMAFLQGVSPSMIVELMDLATDPKIPSKVRLDAVKDILDRAGYGKVNKHAVATVNATDSKEALISMLLGTEKALNAEGIEIVHDEQEADSTKTE